MSKLKTIFLGNPAFSVPTLEALYKNPQVDLIAVCGSPDKPVGRGKKIQSPATINYAKKNNINVFQNTSINKDESFFDFCEKHEPDLIIVLAFSHFLNERVLNLPSIGCFNIHTSVLPKYRGSSPIHYALLNDDKMTGVSIQKMVKKMDAGDIAHFKEQDIARNDDYISLCDKLSHLSAESIDEFIKLVVEGPLSLAPQDESKVTFSPLIKKEDGRINFKEEASNIINKLRAYCVWPGCYFYGDGDLFKFSKVKINSERALSPGEVHVTKNELTIGTHSESLDILTIQPPGKPMMDIKSFFNGHSINFKEVDS